jgi:DNA-binding PadR family transcriptional regulator
MPRSKTHLSASEYAVLGLVRQKPAYGYELQRHLAGGRGLARVCPVEPAMVYAILKSLSGFELIDGEWDRSVYPPRAVYAATAEGDAAFQRWLRSPVVRMREIRHDFMVKLYFAMLEDRQAARDLVSGQIEACSAYEHDIQYQLAGTEQGSFDAMALRSKITAARLNREWLQECLVSLASDQEEA